MEDEERSLRSPSQACAACKYQRRRCVPDCILAPYFPHYSNTQFLRAHRLFGVGKITNMIKDLDPERRNMTMNTILYEADRRAIDPVGGCLSLIQHLQSQLASAQAELQLLHTYLAHFRSHSHNSNLPLPSPSPSPIPPLQQQQQQQNSQHHSFPSLFIQDDTKNMFLSSQEHQNAQHLFHQDINMFPSSSLPSSNDHTNLNITDPLLLTYLLTNNNTLP